MHCNMDKRGVAAFKKGRGDTMGKEKGKSNG